MDTKVPAQGTVDKCRPQRAATGSGDGENRLGFRGLWISPKAVASYPLPVTRHRGWPTTPNPEPDRRPETGNWRLATSLLSPRCRPSPRGAGPVLRPWRRRGAAGHRDRPRRGPWRWPGTPQTAPFPRAGLRASAGWHGAAGGPRAGGHTPSWPATTSPHR